MTAAYVVTRYCANPDRNGNPRRVYVFYALETYPPDDDRAKYYRTDGYTRIVFTVDEGYGGAMEAFHAFRDAFPAGPVVSHGDRDCTVKEYKRFVAWTPEAVS